MKVSLQEMFDNLLPVTGNDGILGLVKASVNFNEEQVEAKFELFAKTCLYVLKRNNYYSAEAVNTFPRFEIGMKNTVPFWLGALETWSLVFNIQYKQLLKEQVDLELIKMLP